MATKITDCKTIVREVTIQGLDCVVSIDPEGIHIIRKGDRHRSKRHLQIGWNVIMDEGAPFMSKGDDPDNPVHVADFNHDDYDPVSFLNYEVFND